MVLLSPRGLLLSVFLAVCLLSLTGHVASADQDVWAYILVGDGENDTLVQRLSPEEVRALADVIAWMDPIGIAFWQWVADWQRSNFLASAGKVRNALISGWNVPSGQIETHHAWAMTLGQFINTVEAFAGRDDGDGEDLLIFYYVGHGAVGAMAPNFKDGKAWHYSLLPHLFRKASCEKLVILDSCYAGSAKNTLSDFAWIMASTGENVGIAWPSLDEGLPFSKALADAMERNQGIQSTFQTVKDANLGPQLSPPELSIPPGLEGDDPLAPSETEFSSIPAGTSATAFLEHLANTISASIEAIRAGSCSQVRRIFLKYSEYYSKKRNCNEPWLAANDASNESDHDLAAAILKGAVTTAVAAKWRAEEAFIAALKAPGYPMYHLALQFGLTELDFVSYIEELEASSRAHRSVSEEELLRNISLEEAWASGPPEWEGSDEFGDWFNATVTPVRLRHMELTYDEWIKKYGPELRQLADLIGCQL